ncbi:MAG TPA: PEP-utilizing enzyme [Thermoanaerobaculia bacterium]|nr:PEP-utilizing enzyme [Thermoanaerobaculia bacterium]
MRATNTGARAPRARRSDLSHAAVVARGMGRPCIVGAGALRVDYSKGELRSEGHEPLEEGDWVSIDGTTGEIIGGKLATRPSEVVQVLIEASMEREDSETFRNFDRLLAWADEIRTLGIRTNADTRNESPRANCASA